VAGNWHSGGNNLDLESWSVKKAKSQITVTEDIFPENKRFVSESNQGQSLPYCAAYHIENSLLVYLGLFSTLRLVFRRYKLYSECLTTTIQKQNYNRASEIHLSVVNGPNYMLFCRKRREEKKNCPKQTSLFVVDDNSFKLTSPGKVLGGKKDFIKIWKIMHFWQNG